jgi:phosphoribosylaminoimidazolecarboxamide formyltransferase / IMP cyclohydrolase
MTERTIRRALISASNKTGLAEFARGLAGFGVQLVSTGGTASGLRTAGLEVTDVSAVTGFPEIMDGRVKTLHPKIHGGLLGDRDQPSHADAMQTHGIDGIDLLAVNLYPFESAVARGADFQTIVENIDIGGPAMIRAAAKNHDWVTVVVDPEDYAAVLVELTETNGKIRAPMRRKLAQIAFARTAAYDANVSNWLHDQVAEPGGNGSPRRRAFAGLLRGSLRYGENPHQQAAFYATGEKRYGVATAEQVQGKELSYNNIADIDAAFELVAELGDEQPACAIIKHANPCGAALGGSLADAYRRALECDPVSAFGGVLAFNGTLDGAASEEIAKIFTEVIIAPDADTDARRVLAAKKNLRLLVAGGLPDPRAPGLTFRSVSGGMLVQTRDNAIASRGALKIVTKRKPSETETADMLFALKVAKHVKSNAIVYARGGATVGIGAGQMCRVDAARLAAMKARDTAAAVGWPEPKTKGSAAASEAFFPFADGLRAVAEAGATAVIQPGGSVRDDEVIAAADELGLAMAFTGVRHFRH